MADNLDPYRDDWRSVARYSVRYQGLYFEGQSHVKKSLATGLTYGEAIELESEERNVMAAQGIRAHILIDLERRDETFSEYRKVRAAREARENFTQPPLNEAMAA